MSGDRTRRARQEYEEAAEMLAVIAEHPPTPEPRPPWWRPLARLRHLRDHGDQLALWAEGVEGFADDFRQASTALARAELLDGMEVEA